MRLSAKVIEQAQPADREHLLSDGDKLYLRVRPGGGKSWQFDYLNVAGQALATFEKVARESHSQADRTSKMSNVGSVIVLQLLNPSARSQASICPKASCCHCSGLRSPST